MTQNRGVGKATRYFMDEFHLLLFCILFTSKLSILPSNSISAKMQSAVLSAVAAFALGFTGFIEGENAVQTDAFAKNLWNASCILPIAGYITALVILHFYKLNDHDVQLMTKVNNGEMSREEAEAQMINKY